MVLACPAGAQAASLTRTDDAITLTDTGYASQVYARDLGNGGLDVYDDNALDHSDCPADPGDPPTNGRYLCPFSSRVVLDLRNEHPTTISVQDVDAPTT